MSDFLAHCRALDPATLGRIAVLMGGESGERAISKESGYAVHRALRDVGVSATPFYIEVWRDMPALIPQLTDHTVFSLLHGAVGEDGRMQALLEWHGIPFVGSRYAACALAMDKRATKWLWAGQGLPVPEAAYFEHGKMVGKVPPFPVVVKPLSGGSSLGVHIARSDAELDKAIGKALVWEDTLMIERYIAGREITFAIVGDAVLDPIEITPAEGFYDYAAKYQKDTKLAPCGFDDATVRAYKHMAWQAFQSVGACHWGRVDMMVDEADNPWLIELNTIPGMTDHSLVPRAASLHGVGFSELVAGLCSLAA